MRFNPLDRLATNPERARQRRVAARAITAAKAQSVVLPGQELTASIIAELAGGILALDERVKALDAQIAETFAEHPQMVGFVVRPANTPVDSSGSAAARSAVSR